MVAVAVLIFSAATALAFQAEQGIDVAIDVAPEGNTATALGDNDSCVSVAPGETFDIDITVRGIEPLNVVNQNYTAEGLAGFEYNFHFDPAVVRVTAVDNDFKLNPLSPFESIIPNWEIGADPAPLPATSGNMRVTFLDASQDYEIGDGVLSRLTLEAIAPGTTTLTVNSDLEPEPAPAIYASFGFSYPVSTLRPAVIAVGSSCDGAPVPTPFDPDDSWGRAIGQASGTPTPTPGPATPTPTLGETDIDEGDTKVSVDAFPEGNSGTELGDIDQCASAVVGQVFVVDVVVEDVEDLIAFEAPVTFNQAILTIIDRDVKQFLAGDGDGQDILDASAQIPNTTGFYRAGAAIVGEGDPQRSTSGSGVLLRLTMQAMSNGISFVAITPVDQTQDGIADTGVLLKNVDNLAIGGPTFRGQTNNGEIRVGSECDSGAKVVETSAPSTTGPGNTEEDDSNGTWVIIAGAAMAVLAVAGGGAYLLWRRSAGGPA